MKRTLGCYARCFRRVHDDDMGLHTGRVTPTLVVVELSLRSG